MDTRAALQQIFGFERFRPGQAEAVDAAMTGCDSLVVMPTGSGKSLCYQLPGLIRDDLTLVVSPLVSLMHDQVEALRAIAPDHVGVVNAQRGGAANASTLERAVAGELRLLYVAPERFGAPKFAAAIAHAGVGLFVVDEAHCVSQWGHDFRPDYFALADAAHAVGARAVMALTATATPQVADDIARRLRLRDPVRVITGFDRPNLAFAVVPCRGAPDKERRIAVALSTDGALPAIVYAGTRDGAERLASGLTRRLGVEAVAYHAGLDRERRATVQERFMAGEVPVIVATNAFGMGVDKADVRTVCHASVPGSLEAYYQEAGRAGRDGRDARCLLFAEQRDKGLHTFFIQKARIDDGAFDLVAERLSWAGADGVYDIPARDLARVVGGRRDDETLRAIIGHLTRAGVIKPSPSPPDRIAGAIIGAFDRRARAECQTAARDGERARWRQYRSVWAYVEGGACRRQTILTHFGDRAGGGPPTTTCCDVCDPSLAAAEVADRAVSPRRATGSTAGPRRRVPAGPSLPLRNAIIDVVHSAEPRVGRTRTVEVLRGGRSRVVIQNGYENLPHYGTFGHLSKDEVLGVVDGLLSDGALISTGGKFPKLTVSAQRRAA